MQSEHVDKQGEQDLVSEGPDNFVLVSCWRRGKLSCTRFVYKDGGSSEDSYKQVGTDENGDSSEDDQETERIWLLHTRTPRHTHTDTIKARNNRYTHTHSNTLLTAHTHNSHTKTHIHARLCMRSYTSRLTHWLIHSLLLELLHSFSILQSDTLTHSARHPQTHTQHNGVPKVVVCWLCSICIIAAPLVAGHGYTVWGDNAFVSVSMLRQCKERQINFNGTSHTNLRICATVDWWVFGAQCWRIAYWLLILEWCWIRQVHCE